MKARGNSHEPLNYLQRRIVKSTSGSDLCRRNVIHRISKAKATTRSDEEATAEAIRIWAFWQILRTQEIVEATQPGDLKYKNAVLSISKLTEIYSRNRPRANDIRGRRAGQPAEVKRPPMRQAQRENGEESEATA